MTGRQIAHAYFHYVGRFVGYRLSLNSVGMAVEVKRVEQDYGIQPHERVPPDVAKTVLQHLRHTFWKNRSKVVFVKIDFSQADAGRAGEIDHTSWG